ncbi:MAG TPA: DPP IV N-terminal domain-containing protein [Bacteroidota bacterium]
MKPTRNSMFLILTIVCFTGLNDLVAQDSTRLSLATMSDPALFRAMNVPRVWWLEDNTAMIFDTRKAPAEQGLERLDPRTGKRTPLLDFQKALGSFKSLFPDGKAPRLGPVPNAFSQSGAYGYYLIDGDIFLLDIRNASVARVTDTKEEEKAVNFSPDGKKLAYVRSNNLYVYDIPSTKEHQLTRDGNETILNGTLSWVYWEEIYGRQDIGYWWSPDSRSIAYLQSDESQVSLRQFVNISPWTPTVTTQRYPAVGEHNPDVRVGIVDLGGTTTTWVKIDPKLYEYVERVAWLPDNRRIVVRMTNRLQTEVDMYFADRSSGEATHIQKETNEGWVNLTDDLYFLKDGKHFIMASERTGYEHLYLFTMDGSVVGQITNGEWAIRSSGGGPYWLRKAVSGIDEREGYVYFTALEKSSLEKHLYRIKLDGSGMKRLTKEDGTHAITMSPDAKYYFDRSSNISTPPSLALYEADGTRKLVLAESDLAGFKTYDAQFAKLTHVPARDGFQIPVSITKPKDFDPAKKYPVIVSVYGGPSAPQVADAFSLGAIWENVLLNNGYVCMTVDNRAATAVSKKLENLLLYRTPGEVELNDLVDAVRWMKQQPGIDPDRFGVTGWSGGGTNTELAMTRSTEFKAGIAGAGVTDFRFYDTKWGEAAMKTEKENLKGYEEHSLLNYAKDLHGKILLVHGLQDDNVQIINTWRFVDELIKANKLFELMIYPMRKHGVGDPAGRRHLMNTELDFWKRNL